MMMLYRDVEYDCDGKQVKVRWILEMLLKFTALFVIIIFLFLPSSDREVVRFRYATGCAP